MAGQTVRPATVTVSIDNDLPEVRDLALSCAREFDLPSVIVSRPFPGRVCVGQVRNNAVRALMAAPDPPAPDSLLVFLDGDICLAPDALAAHQSLAQRTGLVIGFRIDLTPRQSGALDESALLRGQGALQPSADQLAALRSRHRRYARQAFLRRFGMAKAHKPKLLSANFGVRLDAYLAVNGFDEQYEGYGQEDDDLGRRLYAAGYRPAVGVARILAFHLYHPTRAPESWNKAPNVARFLRGGPVRCLHGVENPASQPPVQTLRPPHGTPRDPRLVVVSDPRAAADHRHQPPQKAVAPN